MKILVVSDAWHPQLNGVVRTYEYLMKALDGSGHTMTVIGPADFPLVMAMPGYAEIKLVLFAHRRLKKMIADHAPDHLHIATEGPLGWAARRIALEQGMSFSTCYHTHFPDYMAKRVQKIMPLLTDASRRFAIGMMKKFHDPARALFVATPSLARELRSWKFTAPMMMLTRGIDRSVFYPGPKTLFRDLPGPIALYVGRIAIEKSIEDFLSMPWAGSKIVVGHGPDLDTLKKRYPDAIFTGKKTGKELGDHYRSADIFVFPSRTDTFGMVLIEALACGVPVAAYPVTGPVDIITTPTLGALNDDLSKAAKDALHHGTAEERARHVENHYTWEEAAQQFIAVAKND